MTKFLRIWNHVSVPDWVYYDLFLFQLKLNRLEKAVNIFAVFIDFHQKLIVFWVVVFENLDSLFRQILHFLEYISPNLIRYLNICNTWINYSGSSLAIYRYIFFLILHSKYRKTPIFLSNILNSEYIALNFILLIISKI